MKKFVFVLALAFSVFGFQSKAQTAPEGSPSDVGIKFVKAMLAFDIKSAQKYVTAKGDSALAKVEPMAEAQKSSVPDSISTLLNNAKVTASNEKISGDSATVNITTTFDRELQGEKEKTQTLDFIKEAGIWKVILQLPGM